MKTPFKLQVSEYDCVPTTFLNAISYLFEREEIPPLVVQKIYLYSLDTVSAKNNHGHGTTEFAIKLLGNWLESFSTKSFAVSSEYICGEDVCFNQNNKIARALNGNGVALVNIHTEKEYWHPPVSA